MEKIKKTVLILFAVSVLVSLPDCAGSARTESASLVPENPVAVEAPRAEPEDEHTGDAGYTEQDPSVPCDGVEEPEPPAPAEPDYMENAALLEGCTTGYTIESTSRTKGVPLTPDDVRLSGILSAGERNSREYFKVIKSLLEEKETGCLSFDTGERVNIDFEEVPADTGYNNQGYRPCRIFGLSTEIYGREVKYTFSYNNGCLKKITADFGADDGIYEIDLLPGNMYPMANIYHGEDETVRVNMANPGEVMVEDGGFRCWVPDPVHISFDIGTGENNRFLAQVVLYACYKDGCAVVSLAVLDPNSSAIYFAGENAEDAVFKPGKINFVLPCTVNGKTAAVTYSYTEEPSPSLEEFYIVNKTEDGLPYDYLVYDYYGDTYVQGYWTKKGYNTTPVLLDSNGKVKKS